MKTKSELNNAILETISYIQQNYPELSKFMDEMTIAIPDKEAPKINASTLKDYDDSLQAMAKGYAKSSTNRNMIILAGFEEQTLINHPH